MLIEKLKGAVELIAEIGTNHNGVIDTAYELIDMAADCGIDTVKFQAYEATDIVSPLVKTSLYGINSQYEYWLDFINAKLKTPLEWLPDLRAYAAEKGLDALVTPHSMKIAEFCLNNGFERFKIASMDCNYYPFLADLASLGTPLLLSTGMANQFEIIKAAEIILASCDDLVLFHCVSTYPTRYEEVNLNQFEFLKSVHPKIGLSDHCEENDIAMMSLVYGVSVIEKHITLDKCQDGPDHLFALDKKGLMDLRKKVDQAESALGGSKKKFSSREQKSRNLYRRVAISLKDIAAGKRLSSDDYCFARAEAQYEDTLDAVSIIMFEGVVLQKPVSSGQAIRREHFT